MAASDYIFHSNDIDLAASEKRVYCPFVCSDPYITCPICANELSVAVMKLSVQTPYDQRGNRLILPLDSKLVAEQADIARQL